MANKNKKYAVLAWVEEKFNKSNGNSFMSISAKIKDEYKFIRVVSTYKEDDELPIKKGYVILIGDGWYDTREEGRKNTFYMKNVKYVKPDDTNYKKLVLENFTLLNPEAFGKLYKVDINKVVTVGTDNFQEEPVVEANEEEMEINNYKFDEEIPSFPDQEEIDMY